MLSFKESVCGFSFVIEHLNGSNMKFNHTREMSLVMATKKNKGISFQRGDKR